MPSGGSRSRNRLGILKAITNAWAKMAVPKNLAMTISLAKPRTLLVAVAKPMMPVDFIRLFLLIQKC